LTILGLGAAIVIAGSGLLFYIGVTACTTFVSLSDKIPHLASKSALDKVRFERELLGERIPSHLSWLRSGDSDEDYKASSNSSEGSYKQSNWNTHGTKDKTKSVSTRDACKMGLQITALLAAGVNFY